MTQAISHQPGVSKAAETRVTRLFFLAITAYYVLQIVQRLAMGGGLEADDGEMLMMTPGMQWGYGPQLPFYNWLQVGVFAILGKTLFGITFLKHFMLWATFALLFVGLRAWLPAKQAAIASLSLFLIPDIAWEAERITTHSNAMLAAISGTFAGFLWVMRTGRWRDWIWLGLAVGIGGISKYNYWVVPAALVLVALTMPEPRKALRSPRALIVPVMAAAFCIGPYLWMQANARLAMASAHKFELDESPTALLPEGVIEYLGGLVALLMLPLIVAGVMHLLSRKASRNQNTAPWLPGLMLRMALLSMVVGLAVVWFSGAGKVTTRWLLPIVIPLVLAIYLTLAQRISRKATIAFTLSLALLAVGVFAGLAHDRYKDGARRDFDFEGLAQHIEALKLPPDTVIVSGFYLGGNLALLRPDWDIASTLPTSMQDRDAPHVLFVSRYDEDLVARAVSVGWNGIETAVFEPREHIELPAHHSDATLSVYYRYAHKQ
ncbi:ArnT family glycosyltransferase [Celeribacter persicus]|uniref:Dolichyl-phosphate-mannose-protein mannosyltransferase n=1 Tax=Celeribacter persicus TaxID=1651082 RepID=A0A2T5HPB0_9RHOB|nr:glycosyltransferase family 39 protein [Celeribacter persicus]PTQ73420.1 dolichyl-phosphate-mannose-protein mannosyltransferase [Celeribacter persicus]